MYVSVSPEMLDSVVEMIAGQCNYVSLHSGVPSFASSTSSELAFGAYVRQRVFWTDSRTGAKLQRKQIVFSGLVPPVSIEAIGLNKGRSGNDLVVFHVLSDPVISGETRYAIPAGELVISIG